MNDLPSTTESGSLTAQQGVGGMPSPMPVDETSKEVMSQRALVKKWQDKIKSDKARWAPDFKRMRENMKFAKGIQWPGQTEVDTDKYVNNVTIRMVNNKVATLYARNPTAVANPRKRMNFQVWDEKVESISQAIQLAEQSMEQSGMPDPNAMAMIVDYNNGKKVEHVTQKICDTLATVYQYQVDSQSPEFKEQMKQLVRRTITCGVGYLKINFIREGTDEGSMPVDHIPSTIMDRAKRAKLILDKITSGEVESDQADVETLKSLFASMGASQSYQDESLLQERLEFDFPQATAIIPSSKCRSLKEFIAADYITHEYVLGVDEVNAFYDVRISSGGGDGNAKEYNQSGVEEQNRDTSEMVKTKRVCVWETFDRTTKTTFVTCDGWKDFLVAPEPVDPCVKGFWTIFALTFNDVESEDSLTESGTIYPPSDVQLIKHPQKEWNRTRHALRAQRNANAPKYGVRAGVLTKEDKELLQNAEPNSVIEFQGIPPDQKPSEFIAVMQVAQIDPAVYNTEPLEKDIQLSGGVQQANMGPAQRDVTATVGSIAEQSRQVESSSNADDLDGFLSRVASAAGEIMLRAFDIQTIKMIAGPGAVWPQIERDQFIQTVQLTIVAASSGRPNKAMEVANWQQLGPVLQAAGANPQAIIRETIKRLDDRIDPSDFMPIPQPPPQSPQKPIQELLDYKDAPEDIKRQMEVKGGFQPSDGVYKEEPKTAKAPVAKGSNGDTKMATAPAPKPSPPIPHPAYKPPGQNGQPMQSGMPPGAHPVPLAGHRQ